MNGVLEEQASRVATLANSMAARVVLAESCTAGLAAHFLSRMVGASDWFCGSTVVYRNATKTAWLDVPASLLSDPGVGPVSPETASAMTTGVLRLTPEATLAASVTGHLGPQAPPDLDGVIFVGIERRHGPPSERSSVARFVLSSELPQDSSFPSLRLHRQYEAALHVLQRLRQALEG